MDKTFRLTKRQCDILGTGDYKQFILDVLRIGQTMVDKKLVKVEIYNGDGHGGKLVNIVYEEIKDNKAVK